jgi:hypothetical protein
LFGRNQLLASLLSAAEAAPAALEVAIGGGRSARI